MPRISLTKRVTLAGKVIECRSPGILLREGERYSVIDPANNNELISGMTASFRDMLISKGLMEYIDAEI